MHVFSSNDSHPCLQGDAVPDRFRKSLGHIIQNNILEMGRGFGSNGACSIPFWPAPIQAISQRIKQTGAFRMEGAFLLYITLES